MLNREELSIVLNQQTIFALVNSSHLRILLRSYTIEKKSELLIRITCVGLGGGRTHTWRTLSRLLLFIPSWTFRVHRRDFLCCLPFEAGDSAHLL